MSSSSRGEPSAGEDLPRGKRPASLSAAPAARPWGYGGGVTPGRKSPEEASAPASGRVDEPRSHSPAATFPHTTPAAPGSSGPRFPSPAAKSSPSAGSKLGSLSPSVDAHEGTSVPGEGARGNSARGSEHGELPLNDSTSGAPGRGSASPCDAARVGGAAKPPFGLRSSFGGGGPAATEVSSAVPMSTDSVTGGGRAGVSATLTQGSTGVSRALSSSHGGTPKAMSEVERRSKARAEARAAAAAAATGSSPLAQDGADAPVAAAPELEAPHREPVDGAGTSPRVQAACKVASLADSEGAALGSPPHLSRDQSLANMGTSVVMFCSATLSNSMCVLSPRGTPPQTAPGSPSSGYTGPSRPQSALDNYYDGSSFVAAGPGGLAPVPEPHSFDGEEAELGQSSKRVDSEGDSFGVSAGPHRPGGSSGSFHRDNRADNDTAEVSGQHAPHHQGGSSSAEQQARQGGVSGASGGMLQRSEEHMQPSAHADQGPVQRSLKAPHVADESDNSAPVLRFGRDDAYATADERAEKRERSRQLKAALDAQIAERAASSSRELADAHSAGISGRRTSKRGAAAGDARGAGAQEQFPDSQGVMQSRTSERAREREQVWNEEADAQADSWQLAAQEAEEAVRKAEAAAGDSGEHPQYPKDKRQKRERGELRRQRSASVRVPPTLSAAAKRGLCGVRAATEVIAGHCTAFLGTPFRLGMAWSQLWPRFGLLQYAG
jgi:hypothetical protein